MKKVTVVSKTHLDLGFTDFAENIRLKYLNEFIPNAIDIANEVNAKSKKNFVWTTGSYLLKQELEYGTRENREKLITALKNGYIAPHALPFTMHTELLDNDSLEYALSLVDDIDKIRGRKTIAAKMTDVPGHTKAIVPLLYKKGIKLLHIGVNGASAMPNVPKCFLWKSGESEVVVIYSGEYGGAYKNEYIDDILYFDHTLDNHGASGKADVIDNIEKIQSQYPDCEVAAGTLDDFAWEIWNIRDKLPVVTSEIGDSWIHGSASDPYKSAALRTLIRLKNKWIDDGTLIKQSKEYINLVDNILCLSEHTCGMDVKIALAEYENYLRPDFQAARLNNPNYKKIESSWLEQRRYIDKAVEAMSVNHKKEAVNELKKLRPNYPFKTLSIIGCADKVYNFKANSIAINSYGGIKSLCLNNVCVIADNNFPCITYDSFGADAYNYWFSHYSRNLDQTAHWAFADFGKPGIDKISSDYRQGRFDYILDKLTVKSNETSLTIIADLKIDTYFIRELGAPAVLQIRYILYDNKLTFEILWNNKQMNRLPESIMFHIYPNAKNITYTKIGRQINPFDVVENGSRNLSAVESILLDDFKIVNYHSPLVSIGKGKILKFDNEYSALSDGLTYVLYNNIWGTNFPLWYGDNAYFKFDLI